MKKVWWTKERSEEMPHVFVIDDEQNIRDILEKYLKKEGFTVSTFQDGAEVLSTLYRRSIWFWNRIGDYENNCRKASW